MRSIAVLLSLLALAAALGACSSSKDETYPITFTCSAAGGAACPAGATCPTVPLGSGGCETLPGLSGHPATSVESGRPEGCKVGLSYGNPNYGDTQQTCTCERIDKSAGTKPSWVCPI